MLALPVWMHCLIMWKNVTMSIWLILILSVSTLLWCHLEFEETFQITPSGCWMSNSLFNLLRGGLLKKRNPYIVSTYYFWKVTLLWRLEREFRSCFIVLLTSLHFCLLFLGITRNLALSTLIRLILQFILHKLFLLSFCT